MRSWYPIEPHELDNKRLLGEHNEIHCMFNVITLNKKGYSRHPETLRWKNHVPALVARHNAIALEMQLRGFNHKSSIEFLGDIMWPDVIEPIESMIQKLSEKQKKSHKEV